ncbi:UNVERIFIED_CONTAM: hypothetical protein GTU68_050631 [Idotea baltica]|nr:hypothetical protein [Idotea baltica]
MPITDPTGNMVCGYRCGTTEVAVLSLATSFTRARSAWVADRMDEAIISYLRRQQNLLIGESTAERIKTSTAAPECPMTGAVPLWQIRGRDLLNGVPKELEVSQRRLRSPVKPVQQICEAVLHRIWRRTSLIVA